MQFSENFALAELIISETAKRREIPNKPTPEQIENLRALAENVLQPVRDYFKRPIYVSSGFRSLRVNNAVGGAPNSQHTRGEAADIDNDNTSVMNSDIFNFIKNNLEFDQLIWEYGNDTNPAWVHVSFSRRRNRKEVLRISNVNGRRVTTKLQ